MDGPLKNLLVVDLTRVLVGPYCTMILSDLGARVIKVEAPEIGDDSRNFGPFIKDYSAYFMSLNRGKESIALNLKNAEDKKIFGQILKKADVLVENLTDDKSKAFGRSEYMTSVIFNGKKSEIGKIVQVKIIDSNRNTLFGEIISNSDQKVA